MARRDRKLRPPRRKEVEFGMGDSEELSSKERRRKLIERLNEKEKLIGPQSPARGAQMSEEELAAEIEKQRTLNAARRVGPRSSVYLLYSPNVGERKFSDVRGLGLSMRAWPSRVCAPPGGGRLGA